MPYYDVSIPLKLKILTYYHENEDDLTGFAVTVPLKNKLYDGIVINKREQKPEKVENIKKIEALWGQAYSKIFIEYLKWMSFYYIAEIGTVLRLTFFEEIIPYLKGKKNRKVSCSQPNNLNDKNFFESLSINQETLLKILDAVKKKEYKTFLIHSPSIPYEMKLMIEVATKAFDFFNHSILLISPEIREVKTIYQVLKDIISNNVVMLHSEMRASECYSAIEKIMEGSVKVVVGTRFAIFAPIKKLSLIMLSQESSWLYKAEESPRYNARDCAVMRGFLEGCPVILCDTLPSVTSFWNSMKGKFELIDDFSKNLHPELRIVKQPYGNIFHPDVLLHLKLYEKEGVLVVSPRTGFSLLRCSECGEVLKCEKCGYSLIFHKNIKFTECYRCAQKEKTSETCPYCGGIEIHPVGAGVERLREELENIFHKKGLSIKNYDFGNEQIQGIFVLQAGKMKKTLSPKFKCAVFVDFDFLLSIPDYRAMENAFGKILSLSHLVRHDGIIFVQTRNPESEVFKFLRSYDFRSFYLYEIKQRKETLFPPFVRLIKLTIKLKKTASDNILENIKNFLKFNIKAEIIEAVSGQKKDEFFFILRSQDKRKLTEELHHCIEGLRSFRGVSFKIEVDPISLSN